MAFWCLFIAPILIGLLSPLATFCYSLRIAGKAFWYSHWSGLVLYYGCAMFLIFLLALLLPVIGLVLFVPLACGGPGLAIVFVREARKLRMLATAAANLCLRCGYNLTGNVSGVCPECGEKI